MKQLDIFYRKVVVGQLLLDDEDYLKFKNKRICIGKLDHYPKFISHENKKIIANRIHKILIECPRGMNVDHVDGNIFNCQKSNLRVVTPMANGQNQKLAKRNTSGYRNVTWNKNENKWSVFLRYKGKNQTGGLFNDLEEANKAAIALRKKFGFAEGAINDNYIKQELMSKILDKCEKDPFGNLLSSKNTSGCRGLYYNKLTKKWHTSIRFNKKTVRIGYFRDRETALLSLQEAEEIVKNNNVVHNDLLKLREKYRTLGK